MRIELKGDKDACAAIQGMLEHRKIGGVLISSVLPTLVIGLFPDDKEHILFDSTQGDLEHHALELISELTIFPVAIMRHQGKITSSNEINVHFPEAARHAVEVGIFRAILRTVNHGGRLWWLRRSLWRSF